MRQRSLAWMLTLVAFFVLGCASRAPQPDCCHPHASQVLATLPACCLGDAMPPTLPRLAAGSTPEAPALPAWRPFAHAFQTIRSLQVSRLAQRHVPDQSGRHLALGILLT